MSRISFSRLAGIFFIFTLMPVVTYATLTIQSVGGVSYYEADANSNITIYGGIAGTCTTTTGSSTCNSCNTTTQPAQACNKSSVYGSLNISITFSSDKALSNAVVKIKTDNQAGTAEDTESGTFSITTTAGGSATVTTTWGYLCQNDQAFGSTACTPASPGNETNFQNASRKIYLYVDENADGDTADDGEKKSIDVKLQRLDHTIQAVNEQAFCTNSTVNSYGNCGYELGVGDSKFYLKRLFGSASVVGTAPTKLSSSSPDWYGLAFFAADANVGLIPNSLVEPQIRKYNSSYELEDNTVTGLQNYQNYCLLMANVSKAQNIYLYNHVGASTNDTCAQPSEVVGMLTDKSCFISTAAFGSDMAEQVQLLRQFRNQFLLTNSWGKFFVKTYYQLSPPVAHFIEKSEFLKSITRDLLSPFIIMAWIAVNVGFVITFCVMAFLGVVCIFILKKKRRALIHV